MISESPRWQRRGRRDRSSYGGARTRFLWVLAGLIAVSGASWWLVAGRRGGRDGALPRGTTPGIPDAVLAQRASQSVLAPMNDPESCAAAQQQFSTALRSALESLPREDRLDPRRLEQFIALAQQRLGLFLRPDFKEYLAQHERLAAADASGSRSRRPPVTPENFDAWARRFEGVGVAPADAEVIVRCRAGAPRAVKCLGAVAMVTDEERWYSNAGPMPLNPALRADVYEARFPLEFPDPLTHEMRRGFVGFALVWLPEQSRWLPWQNVLLDPVPTGRAVFPPPI